MVFKAITLFISLLFFLSADLVAQEQGEKKHVLEEVIVTARKQFDVVLDVPISMTVVGGKQLTKNNTLRLEDMALYVPNLFVGETPIANQLFIRGVGSGVNKGFEQTVGTYIDGIYYGRGQLARIPFFDIERIEVLKGPQGILFGKNTVAGALSITTSDPTESFEGNVTGLYEFEHEEYRVDGAVSGSLAEDLTARVAARISGKGGWVKNKSKGDDETDTQEQTIRLSMGYGGFEDTDIVAKYTHGQFDVDGSKMQIGICSATFEGLLALSGLQDDCKTDDVKWNDGQVITSVDGNSQSDFGREEGDTDYDTFALSIDKSYGDYTLSLITGYLTYEFNEYVDNDYSQLSFVMSEQDEEYEQISQEIRFSYAGEDNYSYLFGLYWQDAELDFIRSDNINVSELGVPLSGSVVSEYYQESSTLAAFGQLQWFFNDAWSATLGARFSKEEKEADKLRFVAQLGDRMPTTDPNVIFLLGGFGLASHDINDDLSEDNFTPSLQVQWQPDVDTMMYFSASKGFKGGGFDAAFSGNSDEFDEFEYDKETVKAYEAGAKLRLMEGAANLNVAIFNSEFTDIQVSTFDGVSAFVVGNVGGLTTQGIEVDGRMRLSEAVEGGIAATWLEAEYDDFPDAACYSGQTPEQGCVDGRQDLSGESTQFAPETVFNFYLQYTDSINDDLEFEAVAEAFYSDEFWVANDLDPNLLQDSYTKVNLRLAIAPSDEKWEVALIAKNITDEETISWGNDVVEALAPGSYFTALDRTFNIALQGSYKF